MKIENLSTEQLYELRQNLIIKKNNNEKIEMINELIQTREDEYSQYIIMDTINNKNIIQESKFDKSQGKPHLEKRVIKFSDFTKNRI